mmetsp:Transcript_12057/g.28302  ORF Transcript_12057/g.28302 Transcript_12057/m.28302 type:complete len:315 (+) Transcript_12057:2113-3057(+)
MFMLRSSCAKCRSPASGSGSSQGLFRSLGIESTSWLAWAWRSSRRSFARVPCCMAARCSDPSGFFTIRTGSRSLPERRVWPRRKEGSMSASSTSVSSSVVSCDSMPSPPSWSNVGYCSTGSTPERINCCASKSSCSVRTFFRRTPPPPEVILFCDAAIPWIWRVVMFSASSSSCRRFRAATSSPGCTTAAEALALPLSTAVLIAFLTPALSDPAAALRWGIRSRPFAWSTSLRLSINPPSPAPPSTPRLPIEISLTYTRCPGRTFASRGFSIRFLETWARCTIPETLSPGTPEGDGKLSSTTTPKSRTRWTTPV